VCKNQQKYAKKTHFFEVESEMCEVGKSKNYFEEVSKSPLLTSHFARQFINKFYKLKI